MSSVLNKTPTVRLTRKGKQTFDFSTVGGLDHHLSVLKEVIIFPLIFSKLYLHFNIKAPRGVLFHGPPGTGKTFVAGALVAELNKLGMGKVNFYHRKGADILDKWVGESERKLRELFEKAAKTQPSLIFFDELDGLAPQRSRNNDQIHSSVVTTLLALMDGLDEMPGVIVIGATNRIETIDPALRRAGRFDKELYFPLPSTKARKEIIQVHTRFWGNPLPNDLLTKIAEATMGFSGSDIQALCTEAVLCCLKRSYPTISTSQDLKKIRINVETLKVQECDFMEACAIIVPWSERSNVKIRKLTAFVKPLLQRQLNNILKQMFVLWPHFLNASYRYTTTQQRYAGRLLLIGSNLQGLNNHILPALLHTLEHLPAHVADAPEQVQTALDNARQNPPGIIVLSRIDTWWDLLDNSVQTYLISVLEDLHAGLPLLVVATCTTEAPTLLQDYFYNNSSIVIKIGDPDEHERGMFFSPLFFTENDTITNNTSSKKAIEKKEETRNIRSSLRRRRLSPEVCKLKGDVPVSGERLRGGGGGEYLKRKRSKDTLIPTKRLRSTTVCEAPELINSQQEISSNQSKSDGFRKHLTTVLLDMLFSIENPANKNKNSLTTLFYNENADNQEGVGEDLHCYNNSTDSEKKSLYGLWKKTSHDITEGMPVSRLEMLYDIITVCVKFHRDDFQQLLENLEKLITHFGNSN